MPAHQPDPGIFLQGTGLPDAWTAQAQWCVLETAFGLGQNFLATWNVWQRDPARPRILHFVALVACPATADEVLRAHVEDSALGPLAQLLAAQLWGLQPGIHRLAFEGGHVLLTLCVGDAQAALREHPCQADSVFIDALNAESCAPHTIKAIARCCRIGARLAVRANEPALRDALQQTGFVLHEAAGSAIQAQYNPHWTPRSSAANKASLWSEAPGECVVIGSGIAGASVAASLARRGWKVLVLDAAEHPAAGASGLPAGLFAPHVSGDDNLLSRLTRAGLRATRQQAQDLLRPGVDWAPSGVLQRQVEGPVKKLPHDDAASQAWSRPADAAQRAAVGIPPEEAAAAAHWHPRAGWLRPAALVRALLATPGVRWQGRTRVAHLARNAVSGSWQIFDSQDQLVAQVPLVVLATAYGTRQLTGPLSNGGLPLNALRGQVSWGWQQAPHMAGAPPFPVNGLGSFISDVPHAAPGADTQADAPRLWITGASFERACPEPLIRREDQAVNFAKLQTLLPTVAAPLQPAFDGGQVNDWAGVRCTYADRLPLVGPLDAAGQPGLWVSTAMGSRGLTLAVLCGEVLAAMLHGEPWPLPPKLAAALDAGRVLKKA
jgi:tRNA 5-methylaminomethyl-2-thiouridine biosynthesis bifunctional protein